MPVSTAALIVENDRVLLVKRPPGGDLGGYWELPGGKVDPGESPGEAIERELAEELGITAHATRVVESSEFAHQGLHYELLGFEVDADLSSLVLAEHTDLRWTTLCEALELDLAPSDQDLVRKLIKKQFLTAPPRSLE